MLKKNWFKMPHTALDDARFLLLAPAAQMLYVYLIKWRSRSNARIKHLPGWVQFSDQELSMRLYCTPRTVFRSRQSLYVNGFINYQTTKNRKACRYFVYDEPLRIQPPI